MSDPTRPPPATDPLRTGARALERPGPVTSFRIVGAGVDHDLTGHKRRFTVGRASRPEDPPATADLQLRSRHVSWRHARVEWRRGHLHYRDLDSSNGSYLGGDREPTHEFVIKPGTLFRVADVEIIAMNPQLAAVRDQLAMSVGLDAHLAIDQALALIARESAVIMVGPGGCEQERLARLIHAASVRWSKKFLTLTPDTADVARIDEASGGTVFLELGGVAPRDLKKRLVQYLFRRPAQHSPRPIVSTRSQAMAREAFAEHLKGQFPFIDLVGLPHRTEQIPRLLDLMLAATGCRARTAELGPEPVERLRTRKWKANLESLRGIVPVLQAALAHASRDQAARSAGVTPQAISNAIRRLLTGDS